MGKRQGELDRVVAGNLEAMREDAAEVAKLNAGSAASVARLEKELARRQQEATSEAISNPALVDTDNLRKALESASQAAPRLAQDQAKNPLAIPALTDTSGTARSFALAAAELLNTRALQPQSRIAAIRMLNAAIALLAT